MCLGFSVLGFRGLGWSEIWGGGCFSGACHKTHPFGHPQRDTILEKHQDIAETAGNGGVVACRTRLCRDVQAIMFAYSGYQLLRLRLFKLPLERFARVGLSVPRGSDIGS